MALSLEWLYEAVQRPFKTSITRILKGAIFFLFVIFFVHGINDLEISAIYYCLSLTLPAGVLYIAARREFKIVGFGIDFLRAKSLLKEGWPIAAATLLSQYSIFFGTIFLGYAATSEVVGYFSASHRLIVFIWAYGVVTSNRIILPTLSSLHAKGSQEFQTFLANVTRVLLIFALPIGIIVTMSSSELIGFLFGGQFSPATPILRILIWVLVIVIGRSALEISLIASNKQVLYLKGMVGVSVLHTLLTPLFFYFRGVEGIAFAMLFAEVCYSVYLVIISRIWVIPSISRSFLKIVGASLLTLFILQIKAFSFVIIVVLGLATYLLLLILLKEISKREFFLFRQAFD